MTAVLGALSSEQTYRASVGLHENPKRIIGRRGVQSFIQFARLMLQAVVKVLQELVLPDISISILVILDADWVLPQTPSEGAEIGMFDDASWRNSGPMFCSSLPTMSQSSSSSSTSKT
ncbi:hypothetical protein [Bradyrhizobium japonicum]|uniref:hypothetical protein n=1 Tax=Bradyrhizobium japonicum TaxID=375 RepID=UPI000462C17A|nr:hypothetical protein [Bradyrhizobium japonicum]